MASDRGVSLWSALEQRAAATPDAPFIVEETGGRLSFAVVLDRSRSRAAELASLGVGPGTVVSWQLPSWGSAAVTAFALCGLGAVQNPVLPILRAREVEHIVRTSASELLIVPSVWRGFDHAAMASGLDVKVLVQDRDDVPPPGVTPLTPTDGVAWHFYTSGTTGDPKGARHADAALLHAARGFGAAVELGPEDRVGFPAPLTHIGGIAVLGAALLSGCSLLFDAAFDPLRTPAFFAQEGVTLAGIGTPFFLTYLAAQRAQGEPLFPLLRSFISGGAPKPPSLNTELVEAFGVGIVSGYGMTECPMLAWNSIHDDDTIKATTEGRPIAGVQVRVVDGELRVRGPQLMAGCVDPAQDAEAFDDEGWLRTGDLVRLDADANLTVTGRTKDIIIRNMENISAKEIEDALATHPGVVDCAVIGLPDERLGERVVAVVVAAGDFSQQDMDAHLAELPRQKRPEQLVVVAELPRNSMGKVLKATLRAELSA